MSSPFGILNLRSATEESTPAFQHKYRRKYQNAFRPEHKDELNDYARNYYHKHKEQRRTDRDRYEVKDLEATRARNRTKAKRYNKKLRNEIVQAYGGVCACCGEREERFLTIDHVNNDGWKHRRFNGRKIGSVYQDLRQRGFPKDEFALLCWNCNAAKKFGPCPHKTKTNKSPSDIVVYNEQSLITFKVKMS